MDNNEILNPTQSNQSENTFAEKPEIPLKDTVMALLFYLLSFVFTHFAFQYAGGIWGGIFWSAFGSLGAIFIKINQVPVRKSHIAVFAAAEIFCLTPLFCLNIIVNFFAAVFSMVLYFYLLLSISGGELFGTHFILDTLRAVFVQPFIEFTRQPRCAFAMFKGKNRGKNILFVILGLLTAVPLTVLVVFLLMKSDELFESSMNNVLDNFPELSFSIFWELLFAVPIAMYLFGAVYSSKTTAYHSIDITPGYRILPPVFVYTTVTPACIFYIIYIVMQLMRIGGANKFENASDFSEFARRGFFELCVIAIINLFVIMIMQAFTKRKEGDKRSGVQKTYTISLCVLTLFIIATALAKMFIYIGELGMTVLRVYTSWFMVALAAVFVLIIVWQIRDFKFWRAMFVTAAVMLAIPCFGNFEGMIASYNVSAYEEGKIKELDIDVLQETSFAGVKPASELLASDCCTDSDKLRLNSYLEDQRIYDNLTEKFAYFSIPRAIAQNEMYGVYPS